MCDAESPVSAKAEQARVAYVDQATPRLAFRHPLMRSAVVDLSHAVERRTAHRVLPTCGRTSPRRAWHLAEASLDPDESVAAQLEAAAARILARDDAIGCVKALTRASELSPRSAERHWRLAAAAYIGADVVGDLGNASNVLAGLRRGDVEIEVSPGGGKISPSGILASHVPHALTVLMDLVETAVRTGRDAEAAAHVAAMQEANLAGLSSRLALVVGASAAMAAPDDTALELFDLALALPGIKRWQFDLARVRLAYGERLRRSRAMTEARVQLEAAPKSLSVSERDPGWTARARSFGRPDKPSRERVITSWTV
jgi:hypothetical protein